MAFFDSAYRGTPPRDIGRPRKEFVELVRRGEITGSVLDSGAGPVSMPSSLHRKDMRCGGSTPLRWRSGRRRRRLLHGGLTVHFQVINALELFRLNRKFDTATDSGLFPALSDEDRPIFVDNLAAFLSPVGKYSMLCFSDQEPAGYWPRRISEKEIRHSSREGWVINYSRAATFESRTREQGPRTRLSSISKK